MRDFLKKIVSKINLNSKKTKIIILIAIILIALFFVGRYFYNKYNISDYSEITILVNNREYILAEQKLQGLLEDNAKDPYFLILVARTYVGLAGQGGETIQKNEYLTRSIQTLNIAESINPSISQIYRIKGLAYLNLGEFISSATFYKKALSLNPGSIDILNDLGNLYLVSGDINNTLTYFSMVIEIDPKNEQASIGMIKVLVLQKRYDQALGHALVLDSDVVNSDIKLQLFEILGNVYFNLERYDDAKVSYTDALNINPNSVYAQYGLAEVSFAKSFDLKNVLESTKEAKSLAEKAITIDPSYPYSYIFLTKIAKLTKNKADYDKYLVLAKDKLNSYIYLGTTQKNNLLKTIPAFESKGNDNVNIKVMSVQSTTTPPKGLIIRKN